MLRTTLSAALLIGVSASLSTAQAARPDRGEPTFRTSTSLVLLDISVADRKGQPVRDLDKSTFRVYEDGLEQEVAFFTFEQRPVSWGLVLDRSGSMSGMMDEVYNAALHSVEAGTLEDETFILTFDYRIELVRPFTTDRSSLIQAIAKIFPGGSTALYDAARQGLRELRGGCHQKKVLIVVTDGDDNASRIRFDDLLEKSKQSEAQVYTIGMFSGMGTDERIKRQLKLLSEDTGALAYFPKNVKECDRACKDIAQQVSRQYTIGYYPKLAKWNGQWRTIEVKVRGKPKYSVRARKGYYAVPHLNHEVPQEDQAANSK